MQTWVTLAAKHATLASGIGLGAIPGFGWDSLDGVAVGVLLAGAGFTAVSSSRHARSVPLRRDTAAGLDRAEPSRQVPRALTRIRRRVDGVLTGMLSEEVQPLPQQPPLLLPVPSVAETLPARPDTARSRWHGDYVDAIAGPAGSRLASSIAAGGPGARGRAARVTAATALTRSERQERVDACPYLAVVRDPDDVPGPARRAGYAPTKGGPAYRGARLPRPADRPAGRRQRREDGAARPARPVLALASVSMAGEGTGKDQEMSENTTTGDRKRPVPRHAAPPAGLGAALGRTLASPRLRSRSASHAG